MCAHKKEVFRTRLTVDGSRINIDMDCGTPTASLLTVKLLLNSVISTPGAKFMTPYQYLNTPMERPEYLRMKIKRFSEDVVEQYSLKDKVKVHHMYVWITSRWYHCPKLA